MINIKGQFIKETIEPEVLPQYIGKTVKLHGSIYKIRKMSNFAFVILRTKRLLVQCIYSEDDTSFPLDELKEESCVIVTGDVIPEARSKVSYEIRLTDIKVLSTPFQESPVVINNKNMEVNIDTLLDYRSITLRNEKERAIFKIQEGICRSFREFLTSQHFTEIHSPKIVLAGAEGGSNIFHIDYFGREAYLAQSPQVYKQMMVGVFERVFEIAPVYRAEKHDTSRHLNEYIGIDFEMGYIDSFIELMEMETQMLKFAMQYLKEHYENELSLHNTVLPEIIEIPAIRFHEAKQRIAQEYKRDITDMEDFEPEEEKLLSELVKKETGSDFVFVTHYPSKKRPFYAMEDYENPDVTLSFDLLFRGLEITTGGQRIHNYKEQIDKMLKRGMNPEEFESYLMLHKYGIPPHGGLGLGLERFTSRLLGFNNVRYSSLFPRDIKRLIP